MPMPPFPTDKAFSYVPNGQDCFGMRRCHASLRPPGAFFSARCVQQLRRILVFSFIITISFFFLTLFSLYISLFSCRQPYSPKCREDGRQVAVIIIIIIPGHRSNNTTLTTATETCRMFTCHASAAVVN